MCGHGGRGGGARPAIWGAGGGRGRPAIRLAGTPPSPQRRLQPVHCFHGSFPTRCGSSFPSPATLPASPHSLLPSRCGARSTAADAIAFLCLRRRRCLWEHAPESAPAHPLEKITHVSHTLEKRSPARAMPLTDTTAAAYAPMAGAQRRATHPSPCHRRIPACTRNPARLLYFVDCHQQ